MLPDDDGDWTAPHVFRYTTALTMGNALCFPIETLSFWALSLATMIFKSRPFVFRRAMEFVRGEGPWTIQTFRKHFPLRVFGDDIAVPTVFYDDVCITLEQAGLSVNHDKSCSDSPIREACGAWNYSNTDVRITRFTFAQLSDTQAWISWRANAEELRCNGFTFAATKICEHLIEKIPSAEAALCLQGQRVGLPGYRWNKDLQRVEVCLPAIREGGGRLSLNGYKGFYAYMTDQATFRTVCHGDAQGVDWQWVDVATLSCS